jgi:hypothetical protein
MNTAARSYISLADLTRLKIFGFWFLRGCLTPDWLPEG